MLASDDQTSVFSQVAPMGGRLCFRALREGEAMVGVLQFDRGFVPEEGKSYVMQEHDGQLALARMPIDNGLPEEYHSYGVGDLMTTQIWRKTAKPQGRMVRFIEAFPDTNTWTVYGVSNHSPGSDAPAHRWVDIGAGGRLNPIAEPFDACGAAIGQLLSTQPVWPDGKGVLHTVSQLQTPYRQHFHRYHLLLAEAARDPEIAQNLSVLVATDPYLRHISIGSIEPEYCRYLAKLQDRGLLTVDAPQTAEQLAAREAVSRQIFAELMDTDAPEPSGRRMRV